MTFSLGGEHYEIDLTDEEFATFEETLGSYVKSGRKYRGDASRARLEPVMTPEERQAIRDWGKATGWRDAQEKKFSPVVAYRKT